MRTPHALNPTSTKALPDRLVGPRAKGVVEREIDGCFVLLAPAGTEVFLLNETASDVWRLVRSGSTLEVIVGLLARAYGADPRDIWDDVARTVDVLEGRDLCVSQ